MKVIFTLEARGDLRAIVRWIGLDNLERGTSFSSEIRQVCRTLARFPKRFPVARVTNGHEIRKRVHGRYLILYRMLEKEVEVLRIVHGSRDWAALLGGDEEAATD